MIDNPVAQYLRAVFEAVEGNRAGAVADYIPELAGADPEQFGICLVTTDGAVYEIGSTDAPFTIQSISKPFTYGLALADRGVEAVEAKIGVEPSGEAFNSISLEPGTGRPLNPMINAGAIAATSLVAGTDRADREARLLATYSSFAGRALGVDEVVHESERRTGHRNRAIGHMLRTFEIVQSDPEEVLDLYFRQCSVSVTCHDLGVMAATLANEGVNPVTGDRALGQAEVGRVLSVMTMCGMYDGAGRWTVDVGMPAKSGVSGGIIAVLPGQLGIGVFSPRLNENGNSVRGVEACRLLARDLQLHFLHVARSARSAVRTSFSVRDVPSTRRRTLAEVETLTASGHRAVTFVVQGDLVFGSTERVARTVTERTSDDTRAVVLDLRAVSAADAPSSGLLIGLSGDLADAGVAVVFVVPHTSPVADTIVESDLPAGVVVRSSLDAATEWCEDLLLADQPAAPQPDLRALRLSSGLTDAQIRTFAALVSTRSFGRDDVLFRAGDPADEVFALLDGEVAVHASTEGSRGRRLATLIAGMTFGEAALAGVRTRTTEVVALGPGRCLVLPVAALEDLDDDLGLTTALLRNLLATTFDSIERLNRELRALSAGPH